MPIIAVAILGYILGVISTILLLVCSFVIREMISCIMADYELKKALKTKERIRIAMLKLE